MNKDKDGTPEDIGIDGVDPSVGFLYKTMLQRDPKKRRVKPVQKHLIQVDFGGAEDSDDDSDFEVSKIEDKGSGESDVDDEPAGEDLEEGGSNAVDEEEEEGEGSEGEASDSASESASSSQSDSGGESEPCSVNKALAAINTDDDSDDEDYVPKKEKNSKEAEKQRMKSPDIKSQRTTDSTAPESVPGHLKVIICCVCLGDIRYRDSDHILIEEDDEIVECDNCGASVHEGCYGISEAQSAASTESSASTEPWFCDACKAGVMPNCELCPNKGGIYKETDAGKWVHLVCALYIPGVAFGDVDKLSPVTLFEMPYSKWGAKECSLCEEPAFCRTGVCISCDAGMCRTFFHVTCAQREGLLSEASPEEDIADPFFAYCKLHADKASMRAKRRNWLAIQSRVKKHADLEIEDDKERLRVIRKLNRHRQKYVIAKSKRSPSWVPTTKMVRHLTSCPSAVRRMLRKAEVMGIITQVQTAPHEKPEKRKKWHISPALSVEFITHFLNRNTKITSTRDKLTDLTQQNDSLREQEKVLRHQYDQSMSEMDKLKLSGTRMKDEAEKFWAVLSKFGGKTSLKRPEFLSIKKPPKSPTRRGTPLSPPAIIHQCGLCQKSHDQHLLAKCDKCKLHYHLGCLDPPLTRMPKKTKLMGWQCSECAGSSSDESEETGMDVNAPRRLREKIKEPTKFMPTNAYKFDFTKMHERTQKHTVKMKKKVGSKKRKLPPTDEKGSSEKSEPPILKREKVERQTQIAAKKKQKEKEPDLKAECCVCEGSGTNSNMVRCDECQLCYHFHCLVPPLRKTPKQRGYTWHCEACDPTDNSEDAEMEEEEAEESKSPPPPLLKKEISSGEETTRGRNKTELKS